MGIEIHLLGTPRIQVDGKDIFFTYGKVQALIYYMVVKGVALRDEISGLLWPEKSEVNDHRGTLYYNGILRHISMWMYINFKGTLNNI